MIVSIVFGRMTTLAHGSFMTYSRALLLLLDGVGKVNSNFEQGIARDVILQDL